MPDPPSRHAAAASHLRWRNSSARPGSRKPLVLITERYRIEESTETETEYQLSWLLWINACYQRAALWWERKAEIYRVQVWLSMVNYKRADHSNYRSINGHEVEITVKNLLMEKDQQTTLKFLNMVEKQLPPAAFQPLMNKAKLK